MRPSDAARRIRDGVAERRRRMSMNALMRRATMPPPPSAFGSFGERSIIVPPARVDNPSAIHIGTTTLIHELCWLIAWPGPSGRTPRLTIGDRCSLNRFIKIVCCSEVTLGDDILTGDHVVIADTQYVHPDRPDAAVVRELDEPRPVRIGSRCFLGFGAIILPGVTIGDDSCVGAGAVVADDVPAHAVVVGNPARVVRRLDQSTGRWERVGPAGG